jgi:uncharacterized protein (DUF924 family)
MGLWFARKSAAFDNVQLNNVAIIDYMGNTMQGDEWSTPLGMLARVIVLDQFPRSVFRGTAAAFQHDALVSTIVERAVDTGSVVLLCPIQRFFFGVAAQHSEDLRMQSIGVDIAKTVADGAGEELRSFFQNLKGYPMEHFDVIQRFGRFPSRSAALVRSVPLHVWSDRLCGP